MNIGKKLGMLSILLVVNLTAISLIFYVSFINIQKIQRERMYLSELAVSAMDFIGIVNSLDNQQVAGIWEKFHISTDELHASFEQVETITELQKLHPDLKESMEKIYRLRNLVEDIAVEVEEIYSVLAADVKQYFYEINSTQIINFYQNEYTRNKYDLTEVFSHLDTFYGVQVGASNTMASVNQIISEQSELIDKQINIKSNTIIKRIIVSFTLILLIQIIYTSIISRSIRSRVRIIDSSLLPIGDGDFSQKLAISGSDEITSISASINRLTQHLSQLILETKSNVNILKDKSLHLSSYAEETSASLKQINRRIALSEENLEQQKEMVQESLTAAETLLNSSEIMQHEFDNQSEIIDHSSTAIEQMIANIESLNNTTARVGNAAMTLLDEAENGREKVDYMDSSIESANESSSNLMAAAELINTIAAQTNLLAMNASIEAAHAGQYGRGFAVVAGEIRNLANQTAVQAKRVTADLKEVRTGLDNITEASKETKNTFHDILAQSQQVEELIESVGSSLAEQNSGNQEILEGISDIRRITQNVTNAVTSLKEINNNLSSSMNRLSGSTRDVNEQNMAVLQDTEEINQAIVSILTMIQNNSELMNSLEDKMRHFKPVMDQDSSSLNLNSES